MINLKKNISLTILLLISFIFTYKYTSRLTDYAFLISIVIVFVQLTVYNLENKMSSFTKNKTAALFISTIVFFIIVVFVVSLKIPVESLNVDRCSIINSYIEETLKGNYPYYAKGNNPGPMPFYFLIAFPFYLVGELAILSFIGYGLFILLVKSRVEEFHYTNFFLFYLLTSVYVYWEIAVRSNIFTFSIFILLLMDYFLKISVNKKIKLYAFAIIAGLFLSTRSVYIIVYLVFFLSDFINGKIKFTQLFFIGIFGFFGFTLTFLPLVISFPNDLLIMNPFIIQSSSLLPQTFILPFLILTTLLTITVKNNPDKFFISGVSLFISILIYAIYQFYKTGINEAIYGNSIDISYFILCIPFVVFYMISAESKVSTELA